jgi:dolichol-phosphate mannosyltransferase
MELSIVIPLYDEEANVKTVTEQLAEALNSLGIDFEIVLVDNGSRDSTGVEIDRMLARYGSSVVKAVVPTNRGFGLGVITGLHACRGRLVGFMPGDLQVDPSATARLYEIAKANPRHLVKALRRIRQDGLVRNVLSRVYNGLFRFLYDTDVKDVNGIPKIFPAEFSKHSDLHSRGSFFDAELLIKTTWLGGKVLEVPIVSRKRKAGRSKVRITTILEMLWDLVRFKFGREFKEWRAHEILPSHQAKLKE